jgi:ATP-binding cassette subfamily B protein RaxB
MLSDFLTGRKQHLPVILQSEASECGLACLAMVAAYFGHDINLTGLRRRYPVSNRGANFKKIMEIAAKLGLKSRPLKLELEQTENLKLPCILHWELNHFVVLKTIKGSHYLIHDPSTGERSLSSKDFSAGFTGVALELEPNHVFEPLIMRETLHLMQVFRGVRGLRSSGLQTLLLSCLIIGLTMAIPLLIQIVLDEVLVSKDQKMLLLLILGVGAVAIFRNVSSLLRGFLTIHVGTALSYHMSSSVYRHLLHLPLKFFQRRHMGDVIARFMVLEPLRKFLTEHLVEIIVDGVMMLFMALLMLA